MLIMLTLGFAGLLVRFARGSSGRGHGAGLGVFGGCMVLFGVFSIVFAPNLDPFRDPVFLGHQAREAFTHLAVTLPASWALCLFVAGKGLEAAPDGTVPLGKALAAGVAGFLVGLFLLVAALLNSAISRGQTTSLVLLVFPHFFEHLFSVLVVPFTAAWAYLSCRAHRVG
jgi:hypothetical protein